MLGADRALAWRNVPEGSYGRGGKVAVEIPESLRGAFDSAHAVTLKIELAD
jgi:hypothetical protein